MRTDESGKPETLALHDFEPGNYWMEIGRNPPWYVQSAECGDVDLLKETLTISSGVPCSAIDIALRDDGATVTVNPQWEGAPEQAYVLMLPENAPQQAIMSIVQKDGQIEIEDLAPGPYNALLVDRLDDLEYKNPEAMSAYASKAAHVVLGAGQKTAVRLELIRR